MSTHKGVSQCFCAIIILRAEIKMAKYFYQIHHELSIALTDQFAARGAT